MSTSSTSLKGSHLGNFNKAKNSLEQSAAGLGELLEAQIQFAELLQCVVKPGDHCLGKECPCTPPSRAGKPDGKFWLCKVVKMCAGTSGQGCENRLVTTPWEMAKSFLASKLAQHVNDAVSSDTIDVNQFTLLGGWSAMKQAALARESKTGLGGLGGLGWPECEWESFVATICPLSDKDLPDGVVFEEEPYQVKDSDGTVRFNGIAHLRNRALHQGRLTLGDVDVGKVKNTLRYIAARTPPGVDRASLEEDLDICFPH
jgi:hypothetical protein